MNSQDTESGEHDRKSVENVLQCLIVWLSCLFFLKNQALIFFFPSQLILHNLQFSNTKRIQLQKDHSSLGQGIHDFPSQIGKSHVGLWAAQQQDSLGLPVWHWFEQRSHFLSPRHNALSWTADAIDHPKQNTNTLWPLLNRNASA